VHRRKKTGFETTYIIIDPFSLNIEIKNESIFCDTQSKLFGLEANPFLE